MHGARNVSRAPRVLCRARRPEPLTDVLLTRTHIEHEISRVADGGFDVLPRGESVGARGRKNVRGFGRFRHVRGPRVTGFGPSVARLCEDPHISVSVCLEQPESERCAVAVDNDGAFGCDARPRQEPLQICPSHRPVGRIPQIGVGVPEDGPRKVALLVRLGIDVHLDQPDRRITEASGNPVGIDNNVRLGIRCDHCVS